MIRFVIFFIAIAAFSTSAFCQCPPGIVRIQTPQCESPTNLRTSFINCTTIKMAWKGKKDENYLLFIFPPDSTSSKITEIKVGGDSCDNFGNCSVSIPVVQGKEINWDVQSVCMIDSVMLYSYKSGSQKATAPFCAEVTADKSSKESSGIQVFPNPSTGYLNVTYTNNITGNMEFSIFDVNGKTVFQKLAEKGSESSNVVLDLRQLAPGSYFLKITIGQNISQTKFILLKKQ